MLKCTCGRIIMDKTSDGGHKVRARMLVFNPDGTADALCPSCKEPVKVPVTLGNVPHELPKTALVIHKEKNLL